MSDLSHEIALFEDGTGWCSTENIDASECVADNVPPSVYIGHLRALVGEYHDRVVAKVLTPLGAALSTATWHFIESPHPRADLVAYAGEWADVEVSFIEDQLRA